MVDTVNSAGGGSPDLRQEAGTAAQRVTETAKQEARSVGYEAKDQARRLVDVVGEEVRSQASTQQHRAAGGLRDVGEQFSRMADASEADGMARQLVGTVGDRAERTAAWLDRHEPGDLLEEVKRFARRRPGVFLAIAAGTGVLIGRLTRSLASGADDGGESSRDDGGASTRGDGAAPLPNRAPVNDPTRLQDSNPQPGPIPVVSDRIEGGTAGPR